MQNQIEVVNSKPEDTDIIFEFYDMAVANKKKVLINIGKDLAENLYKQK